eukprot:3993421-Pyramimonas_sp.AAC.1
MGSNEPPIGCVVAVGDIIIRTRKRDARSSLQTDGDEYVAARASGARARLVDEELRQEQKTANTAASTNAHEMLELKEQMPETATKVSQLQGDNHALTSKLLDERVGHARLVEGLRHDSHFPTSFPSEEEKTSDSMSEHAMLELQEQIPEMAGRISQLHGDKQALVDALVEWHEGVEENEGE